MRIGFTGSREQPTRKQRASFALLLEHLGVKEMDHGDCIGSDSIAHEIALEQEVVIHIHPPADNSLRAFCEGASYIYPPRPYLERNRRIADSGWGGLIGMPNTTHERQRSGTWSTLRYAKRAGHKTYIVWPNGDVTKEWGRSAQKMRL